MLMGIYRDANKSLSCLIMRIIYCHSPGRLWSRFESFQFNRKQQQKKKKLSLCFMTQNPKVLLTFHSHF